MQSTTAASSAPDLSNFGDMEARNYSESDLPSPGISVEFHGDPETRPPLLAHLSAPAAQMFKSPIRQHKRTPSHHREIKETLDARSEYTSDDQDGHTHHKINQYTIKEEIGRGSYGAVHLATDQYGQEYAVKEFSKTRLRKRAQSNFLRHGPRRPNKFPPGIALNRPLSPKILGINSGGETNDALFLIREEIAIMKKLNHPNLVQLIEVLDDPMQDSLYMVLEMCKKGVVMKVGLDEPADPYSEEVCRYWFRDLLLGIEYLHEQGIVHRDIKPDNLLLTTDDMLKVVDFGVSEMFEKPDTNMRTKKSAGSPAFLPPELCVARHGDVSGKACDIWSMGVSLFCLRYGRIPFERSGVLEMYEAIKTEGFKLADDENEDLVDLIHKILEKDPDKRIKMPELREHPWITKRGEDPLLSREDNCAEPVEPPNALEVNHAFTRRMSHLLCVMKAISKFKGLISAKPSTPKRESGPAPEEDPDKTPRGSVSMIDTEGLSEEDKQHAEHAAQLIEQRVRFMSSQSDPDHDKGHAHDLGEIEPRFLGIGTGGGDDFATPGNPSSAEVVSDSPTAVDFNVYDKAYETEVKRIRSQRKKTKMYLTKLLKEKEQFKEDSHMIDASSDGSPNNASGSQKSDGKAAEAAQHSYKFAKVVAEAVKDKTPKPT